MQSNLKGMSALIDLLDHIEGRRWPHSGWLATLCTMMLPPRFWDSLASAIWLRRLKRAMVRSDREMSEELRERLEYLAGCDPSTKINPLAQGGFDIRLQGEAWANTMRRLIKEIKNG